MFDLLVFPFFDSQGGQIKVRFGGTLRVRPTDLIIPDIGILPSTDILAIDQASVDLVFRMSHAENHDLVERIESRHGLRQLSYMRELKMGNPNYELISIDD